MTSDKRHRRQKGRVPVSEDILWRILSLEEEEEEEEDEVSAK